ncbi:MAG: 50S ribosomal protein L24 [Candidatus Doudnabacteria bacterium]
MKLKKGDNVIVTSGKDRGKKGKIVRTFPQRDKIIVEGANLVIRYTRPKKQGEKGQRVEVNAPIHISNAKLICPKCGKGTRVGVKISPQGKRRLCKKCGEAFL